MVTADLAFRDVQLFQAKGDLVSKEGFSDVRDRVFQQIVLQDEGLQASVASEALSDDFSSLCAEVAVAHVQVLEDLVAAQELLYHPEVLEILVELILGDVEGLDFIVGLQANQQCVQAFRCD